MWCWEETARKEEWKVENNLTSGSRSSTTLATNLELQALGKVSGPGRGKAWYWLSELRRQRGGRRKEALQQRRTGPDEHRALRPLSATAMEQWKRHFQCEKEARRDCPDVCGKPSGPGPLPPSSPRASCLGFFLIGSFSILSFF